MAKGNRGLGLYSRKYGSCNIDVNIISILQLALPVQFTHGDLITCINYMYLVSMCSINFIQLKVYDHQYAMYFMPVLCIN